jgi:hypothetical protein
MTTRFSRFIFVSLILLLASGIALGTIYIYRHPPPSVSPAANSPKPSLSLDSPADLATLIGNIIELPSGETPTVAIISDVSKLRDRPLFAKAENGDRLLVYTKNGKAFLYRPGSNKLVDVFSWNSTSTASAISGQAAGISAAASFIVAPTNPITP